MLARAGMVICAVLEWRRFSYSRSKTPSGGDHHVEEEALEDYEEFGVFAPEEDGFGEFAIPAAVLGDFCFAFFGFRAGGFPGIAAICFDLFFGCHFVYKFAQAKACATIMPVTSLEYFCFLG
jgi:hypothetical protein